MPDKPIDNDTNIYDFRIPSGFPSPALDHLQERIDLNKMLIQHPLSTFIVECEGESMIDAFIPPKATLLVDKAIHPHNGDLVVAVFEGEFTIRYLRKFSDHYWLCPANKGQRLQPVPVPSDTGIIVWGVVTRIIIDPNDVKACMPW